MTMRRVLSKITVVALIVLLTMALVEFGWAYFKSPTIVARFEHVTPLQLTPYLLGQGRVEWLLAVEDPNFYHHHGLDLRTPGAGYTTITQGVVKILFFENFKPGLFRWRKAKQIIIAIAFNARVPKNEQLTLFINTVNLGTVHGRDIKGFSEASETYFKKPTNELTDQEYLSLVAMIVAPSKYNVLTHPTENHERVQRIENLLAGKCKPKGLADIEYSACGQ
ncbi:MAG TPA: biosynthetic peptidoglycan transglycosylase [Alphaproteobacteria bacterium]|nr:biosynthetic peptidoglycan transglycosylase [Alphaproteobacteria bacterium]